MYELAILCNTNYSLTLEIVCELGSGLTLRWRRIQIQLILNEFNEGYVFGYKAFIWMLKCLVSNILKNSWIHNLLLEYKRVILVFRCDYNLAIFSISLDIILCYWPTVSVLPPPSAIAAHPCVIRVNITATLALPTDIPPIVFLHLVPRWS